MNEVSNSSSVSNCGPLSLSFNCHLNQSFGSSYKKLKLTNTEVNLKADNAVNETVESILNCPIQGCSSQGHLDGLTERHFSFDVCPIYFGMTNSECVERRKQIEAKLLDLEKKLANTNEKKSPSQKVILQIEGFARIFAHIYRSGSECILIIIRSKRGIIINFCLISERF